MSDLFFENSNFGKKANFRKFQYCIWAIYFSKIPIFANTGINNFFEKFHFCKIRVNFRKFQIPVFISDLFFENSRILQIWTIFSKTFIFAKYGRNFQNSKYLYNRGDLFFENSKVRKKSLIMILQKSTFFFLFRLALARKFFYWKPTNEKYWFSFFFLLLAFSSQVYCWKPANQKYWYFLAIMAFFVSSRLARKFFS